MAPNLAKSTLVLIHDMISSDELTTSQMAEAAGCSKRAIIRIWSNPRLFGSVKVPIKAGRPQSMTLIMLKALHGHQFERRVYTSYRMASKSILPTHMVYRRELFDLNAITCIP